VIDLICTDGGLTEKGDELYLGRSISAPVEKDRKEARCSYQVKKKEQCNVC
jgi:hypothetical protein